MTTQDRERLLVEVARLAQNRESRRYPPEAALAFGRDRKPIIPVNVGAISVPLAAILGSLTRADLYSYAQCLLAPGEQGLGTTLSQPQYSDLPTALAEALDSLDLQQVGDSEELLSHFGRACALFHNGQYDALFYHLLRMYPASVLGGLLPDNVRVNPATATATTFLSLFGLSLRQILEGSGPDGFAITVERPLTALMEYISLVDIHIINGTARRPVATHTLRKDRRAVHVLEYLPGRLLHEAVADFLELTVTSDALAAHCANDLVPHLLAIDLKKRAANEGLEVSFEPVRVPTVDLGEGIIKDAYAFYAETDETALDLALSQECTVGAKKLDPQCYLVRAPLATSDSFQASAAAKPPSATLARVWPAQIALITNPAIAALARLPEQRATAPSLSEFHAHKAAALNACHAVRSVLATRLLVAHPRAPPAAPGYMRATLQARLCANNKRAKHEALFMVWVRHTFAAKQVHLAIIQADKLRGHALKSPDGTEANAILHKTGLLHEELQRQQARVADAMDAIAPHHGLVAVACKYTQKIKDMGIDLDGLQAASWATPRRRRVAPPAAPEHVQPLIRPRTLLPAFAAAERYLTFALIRRLDGWHAYSPRGPRNKDWVTFPNGGVPRSVSLTQIKGGLTIGNICRTARVLHIQFFGAIFAMPAVF
ncbi:hypothetical protein H9P43_002533 [Blastocladiella emersonii ATCC 22665]|nr:hypothetical protein H9P43_002533 [Blastocladiella emersonii ATCC 22665]